MSCTVGNQFCLENNLYLLFAGYRNRRGPGLGPAAVCRALLPGQRATNLKAQFVHLCQLVTRSKIKRINKMCPGTRTWQETTGKDVEKREGATKRVKYIQQLLPLLALLLLLLPQIQRYFSGKIRIHHHSSLMLRHIRSSCPTVSIAPTCPTFALRVLVGGVVANKWQKLSLIRINPDEWFQRAAKTVLRVASGGQEAEGTLRLRNVVWMWACQ